MGKVGGEAKIRLGYGAWVLVGQGVRVTGIGVRLGGATEEGEAVGEKGVAWVGEGEGKENVEVGRGAARVAVTVGWTTARLEYRYKPPRIEATKMTSRPMTRQVERQLLRGSLLARGRRWVSSSGTRSEMTVMLS